MLTEELKNIPVKVHVGEWLSMVSDVPSSIPYERFPTMSSLIHIFKVSS